MRSLLDHEQTRLASLGSGGVHPLNLSASLQFILEFCERYHKLYMEYLEVVLPQHAEPVRCQAGCANCCHHYPMSVEPFELLSLYSYLRSRDDFASLLESCWHRTRAYAAIDMSLCKDSEDEEEFRLHRYYGRGYPCPFIMGNGDCGVYRYRPLTCRMYFSHTDPQFCVPEHLQTPLNRSFIVYLPDRIEEQIAQVSSHYASLELPESLYEGLLAVNALEGYMPHEH